MTLASLLIYVVRLVFAMQEGKWVFTDAVATTYAQGISPLFLSLFGSGTCSPVTRQTMNKSKLLLIPP